MKCWEFPLLANINPLTGAKTVENGVEEPMEGVQHSSRTPKVRGTLTLLTHHKASLYIFTPFINPETIWYLCTTRAVSFRCINARLIFYLKVLTFFDS